jgi:adenylate cyclase
VTRNLSGTLRLAVLLALVAVVAPTVAVVIGAGTRTGMALERQVYDGWFGLRGPLPRPAEVVVVAIDETSEEDLDGWPWSREWHGHLLRNLHRAGARAVAFDITMPTPRPGEDEAFRAALEETGIGILAARDDLIVRRGAGAGSRGLEEPSELLRDSAPLGIVSMFPDPVDAVIREYPLVHHYEIPGSVRIVPQLGVATLLLYLGLSEDDLETTVDGWRLGELEIPRGPGGGMLINFLGSRGSISSYSYIDILDDAETSVGWDMDEFEVLLEREVFRDKIVLVGSTIVEHQDFHPTPFRQGSGADDVEGNTPGVEIHAQAIATILSGDHIRRLPLGLELGWIYLLSFLVVGLSVKVRGLWGAGTTVLLSVGTLWVSWHLFSSEGIWLWSVAPILSMGLAWSGSTATFYLLEEREKARIRGMFQQYVAASVVDELLKKPELLALGGEERVLSVLFSDVVGFSTVSEQLTPTQLVELLNEYLTAMTEIVLEHGGIIDKYQGDALMAEFGAPVPMADHAVRACLAALDMKDELVLLREKWAKEGKPLLEARSGINTGQMLVGNLGSQRIMDYTVMGDNVNLASRLEGTNKVYGTDIMISEFTWDEVKDRLLCRELDRIRVKGKEEPVKIFEVVADREKGVSPETEALLDTFAQALELYKKGRFADALEAFDALAREHPGDGPTGLYVSRCRGYLAEPPPSNWDGVYTMTTK